MNCQAPVYESESVLIDSEAITANEIIDKTDETDAVMEEDNFIYESDATHSQVHRIKLFFCVNIT